MGKKSKRPGRANRPANDKRSQGNQDNQDNQHNASSRSASVHHAVLPDVGVPISELEAHANRGDVASQMSLAQMYYCGNGVAQDYKKVF